MVSIQQHLCLLIPLLLLLLQPSLSSPNSNINKNAADDGRPRVLNVDVQIRELHETLYTMSALVTTKGDDLKQTDRTVIEMGAWVYETAVYRVLFDQPIYYNHSISLYALHDFMRLKPTYRQVLYGGVRLQCGQDEYYESYPSSSSLPHRTDDGYFPRYLIPLPQAQYQSFEWLNVLGQPENISSTGHDYAQSNTLTYLLLLNVRAMQHHDNINNQYSAMKMPAGGVRRVLPNERVITTYSFMSQSTAVNKCRLQLLSPTQQQQQQQHYPVFNLTNYHNLPVHYESSPFQPRPAQPRRRSFHSSRNIDGTSVIHSYTERMGWHNNDDDDDDGGGGGGSMNVFLAEEVHTEHKVKGGMGTILAGVFDKVLQITLETAERIYEYAVPAVTAGLDVILSGAGAPGVDPTASVAYPAFIELDTNDEDNDRQTVMMMNTSNVYGLRNVHGKHLAYHKWRSAHPHHHHRGITPATTSSSSSSSSSLNTDGLPRFSTLKRRPQYTGPISADKSIHTEPGILSLTLITFLIRELSLSVPTALAEDLSNAIREDVVDMQLDNMREETKDWIVHELKILVTNSLNNLVSKTVPVLLERYLPPVVTTAATWTLTHTLTRGLVHTLTPTLALALARPPEEQYICSVCYYEDQYCHLCSWTDMKKRLLFYHADFMASYYSDTFTDHFLNDQTAPSFPQAKPDTYDWVRGG